MSIEIWIIISLILIIVGLLLYIIFYKVPINQLENELIQESFRKSYENHMKYSKDLIKKFHNLNLEIDAAYQRLNIKNKDYTQIKFDTDTTNQFEDSQKINLKG